MSDHDSPPADAGVPDDATGNLPATTGDNLPVLAAETLPAPLDVDFILDGEDDTPLELSPKPVIIDRDEQHRSVARLLRAELISNPGEAAGRPLFIVAAHPRDVPLVHEVCRQLTVAAVITWQLPESAISRLLDLPQEVPLYIGVPSVAAIINRQCVDRSTERSLTVELANLESLFSRPSARRVKD